MPVGCRLAMGAFSNLDGRYPEILGVGSAMWQSRPVFISSTFADMRAEREYLRTRVFLEQRH